MFRVILLSQWKWSRLAVVAGAVAAFALPVLSLQAAGGAAPAGARELLSSIERWGVPYRLLALVLGLVVGIAAWSADHRGRHVYALVLPVERWRYALLRLGAGFALLAPAVAAIAIGGLLATLTTQLPAGLHGYPLALTLRFALALALSYAVFFAISAGTARTAGAILVTIGVVVAVQVLSGTIGLSVPLGSWLLDAVLDWRGPFAVFSGRWMLVDV